MSLKVRLLEDLKSAMKARDKFAADVLSGLRGAVLNEEISKGKREEGLSDEEVEILLTREAKKREEAAVLYEKGGQPETADKERREKAIIEQYLPKQLSDEELSAIVDQVMAEMGSDLSMGPVIGRVKARVGNQADGGRIAAVVKGKL